MSVSAGPHPGPPPAGEGESLPSKLPRPAGELERLEAPWKPPTGWRYLKIVTNSDIGLMYIVVAMLFFVLAGLLALMMRAQLALPDNELIAPSLYNQLFTMHGTVMMFLFAVPMVEAIAVYMLPNMLGARDLPFPRLGAYAFWAYAIGGLAFFCTLFFGVAPDGGWFMYPPLTSAEYSAQSNADWWLLGIGFIEISAIAGAIELIIGILMTRAPGMTLGRMPIFAWAMLVTALMVIFAFPAVIAGTTLLELERAFDWPFFIAERGGDPILWQHLFWFFGHPEVYIIFLPAAGLVTMMIPTLAGVPIAGYRLIVIALVAVGVFGFGLWAHHMFTAGLGTLSMLLVSAASMAVAIPSGIQVFAWLATLWRGQLRITAAALFLLGFLFIFVLGGLTGVMVAVLPFDWQVHDTYFIVAHFHYVLIGGMVFPVFAALYHWAPLVAGNTFSERWARWVFGFMFIGFNLAFFPMHISGILGMPRRVYTYAGDLGWNLWNLLSSIGALVFAFGVALFLFDALRTWRRPERPSDNPWNASTLEWLPNQTYGLRSIPEVDSRDPLWTRPSLLREVEAGAHWLPGSLSGARETLITSARKALPRHVVVLTGDSWWPITAAAGTAGFFLLLTAKLMWLAAACGLIAVLAMLAWVWDTDPKPHARFVVAADNRAPLPMGAIGAKSHSFWAVVVLLIVDASIYASYVFSHVHVSLRADVCPPPGSALPAWSWVLASVVAWLAGSLAIVFAQRSEPAPTRASKAMLAGLVIAALVCAVAAMVFTWLGHSGAKLDPTANAWSATVGAMVWWQIFHVVVLVLMGGYVLARSGAGCLAQDRRAPLDNTALMWHYVTVQGIVTLLVVQWLPGWIA